MLTVIKTGADAILRRAHPQNVALKAQATPIIVPILIAGVSAFGIAGACISEFYSAGVGFHAAFPVKSDGTSLADELMTLRYPIIFCLLAGDVILHAISGRAKRLLDAVTNGLGLGAILLLLGGVGAFMFSATSLTLGNGEDQTFASGFVGLGLATASTAMFGLSFLACHAFLGKIFGAVPTIVAGLRERAHIRVGEQLIREVEARGAHVETGRAAVAEMEKPGALARKTANEAGTITGKYQAIAHDLVATRKAMGDAEVGPDDVVHVPNNVPLSSIEERQADLAPYTFDYFLNLIIKSTKG
jgi:hypothetical protein